MDDCDKYVVVFFKSGKRMESRRKDEKREPPRVGSRSLKKTHTHIKNVILLYKMSSMLIIG